MFYISPSTKKNSSTSACCWWQPEILLTSWGKGSLPPFIYGGFIHPDGGFSRWISEASTSRYESYQPSGRSPPTILPKKKLKPTPLTIPKFPPGGRYQKLPSWHCSLVASLTRIRPQDMKTTRSGHDLGFNWIDLGDRENHHIFHENRMFNSKSWTNFGNKYTLEN